MQASRRCGIDEISATNRQIIDRKAATSKWKDVTKNCKRDLIVKKIVLVALAIFNVLAIAAGFGLMCSGVAIIPGLTLFMVSAFVGLPTLVFLGLFQPAKDYGDKEVAQRTVNEISVGEIDSDVFNDQYGLIKYGFIEKSKFVEIYEMRKNYKDACRALPYAADSSPGTEFYKRKFKEYIATNVTPCLPDPK